MQRVCNLAFVKSYVITTGAIFGLITVAHIWRIIEEWPRFAKDPWYILLTLLAASLCVWAWRLRRVLPESRKANSYAESS